MLGLFKKYVSKEGTPVQQAPVQQAPVKGLDKNAEDENAEDENAEDENLQLAKALSASGNSTTPSFLSLEDNTDLTAAVNARNIYRRKQEDTLSFMNNKSRNTALDSIMKTYNRNHPRSTPSSSSSSSSSSSIDNRKNEFKRNSKDRLQQEYTNAKRTANLVKQPMVSFDRFVNTAWEYQRYLIDGQPEQTKDQKTIFQHVQSVRVGSIEGLNTHIGNIYRGRLLDSRLTPPMEQRTRIVKDMSDFGLPEFIRMYSSGNDSDCLIHSFLTSTCSNFRQLSQEDKNTVASNFRRYVYTTLPEVIELLQAGSGLATRIEAGNFLEDEDIGILCRYYEINMIVFANARVVGTSIQPATARIIDTDTPVTYMIYNTGVHWESVKKEGHLPPYSLTRVEAAGVRDLVNNKDMDPANQRKLEAGVPRGAAAISVANPGKPAAATGLERESSTPGFGTLPSLPGRQASSQDSSEFIRGMASLTANGTGSRLVIPRKETRLEKANRLLQIALEEHDDAGTSKERRKILLGKIGFFVSEIEKMQQRGGSKYRTTRKRRV